MPSHCRDVRLDSILQNCTIAAERRGRRPSALGRTQLPPRPQHLKCLTAQRGAPQSGTAPHPRQSGARCTRGGGASGAGWRAGGRAHHWLDWLLYSQEAQAQAAQLRQAAGVHCGGGAARALSGEEARLAVGTPARQTGSQGERGQGPGPAAGRRRTPLAGPAGARLPWWCSSASRRRRSATGTTPSARRTPARTPAAAPLPGQRVPAGAGTAAAAAPPTGTRQPSCAAEPLARLRQRQAAAGGGRWRWPGGPKPGRLARRSEAREGRARRGARGRQKARGQASGAVRGGWQGPLRRALQQEVSQPRQRPRGGRRELA